MTNQNNNLVSDTKGQPLTHERSNEEILKEFEKTKFAKSGGSCFECCDYAAMIAEVRDFLKKQLEAKDREWINKYKQKKMKFHDVEEFYPKEDK